MGAFAVGAYALALELVVECTYPVDQATSTAFVFLSSALQGVILMFMENVLSSPLENAEAEKIQTCSRPHHGGGLESHDVLGANVTSGSLHQSTLLLDGHHRQGQEARDYTDYLNFLAVFIWTTFAVFAFLFKTEMKRTNADKLLNEAHLNRELSNTSGSLHSSPNASSHDSCGLSTTDTSSGRSRSSSSDGSSLGKTPIIKDSKRRLTPEDEENSVELLQASSNDSSA